MKAADLRQASGVPAGVLLAAANSDKELPRLALPTQPVMTDPFKYEYPDAKKREFHDKGSLSVHLPKRSPDHSSGVKETRHAYWQVRCGRSGHARRAGPRRLRLSRLWLRRRLRLPIQRR